MYRAIVKSVHELQIYKILILTEGRNTILMNMTRYICKCLLTCVFNINTVYLLLSRLLPKNLKIKIYRIIILPVVLYGCETWSLTLREERKLKVFENMVLRSIFGPRRNEVTGEWRRLHNEELSDLYTSSNIVRVIK